MQHAMLKRAMDVYTWEMNNGISFKCIRFLRRRGERWKQPELVPFTSDQIKRAEIPVSAGMTAILPWFWGRNNQDFGLLLVRRIHDTLYDLFKFFMK